MNRDVIRLVRWMRRAAPPRRDLVRALVAGFVASLTNAGLFAGAVALLVVSATRPGLRAVAGALIVIELLAFLRSPLRFRERLSAHQLGFAAVTRWRHWLVGSIGRWDYRRWRSHASGDLLERALRDTDELQDLWLRGVLPSASTLGVMATGDAVIALLTPRAQWWHVAVPVALVQLAGVAVVASSFAALVRADRSLRHARGAYQATLVELGAVTPELALLGAQHFAERRSAASRDVLARAESVMERQRRRTQLVPLAGTAAAIGLLAALHPVSSPTWVVVAAMVALTNFEALGALRGTLDTAVAISAAAERLDELEAPVPAGDESWPDDHTLHVRRLHLSEQERTLVEAADFDLSAGRHLAVTGPSGTGKSTLLRALAGLECADSGSITIGPTPIERIDETTTRRHLAYVASEPGLVRGFVTDVLLMGRTGERDVIDDLATLGLPSEPTARWDELSRGERQRVAIVRALASAPDIVLLDEPTSGLGANETRAVLALLEASGASVVVATHDPLVIEWCDEVLALVEGSLRPSR